MRLTAFAALAALLQSFSVAASADPRDPACPSLLEVSPRVEATPSPADVVAGAWFENGFHDPAFGSAEVSEWLERLRSEPDARAAIEMAFLPPSQILSAVVLEGYQQLAGMTSSLEDSGALFAVDLAFSLKSRIAVHLGEVSASAEVSEKVLSEREEVRSRSVSVRVGSEIRDPVLVLPPDPSHPESRLVTVGRGGEVVFSRPDGTEVTRVDLQATAYGPPVRLGNGNILVLSPTTGGHILSANGAQVSRISLPEFSEKVTPIRLKGDGLLLVGSEDLGRTSEGHAVFISADGTNTVERSFHRNEFETQPLKLADGSIVVAGGFGDLFYFDSSGDYVGMVPLKGRISHPPAQLLDGTIVVGTDEGTVHFFNADGTPKTSWMFFDKKIELGEKISSAPIPLPDGRVAVLTWRGLITICDSNGAIEAQGRYGKLSDGSAQLLSSGALLVGLGDPDPNGGDAEVKYVRIRRVGDGLRSKVLWKTEEMLTSPLVRLQDGLLAAGTIDGELLLMDEEMREISRIQTDRALRMPTQLLPDGRLAVGGSEGVLHLMDLDAAKEGIPLDHGR